MQTSRQQPWRSALAIGLTAIVVSGCLLSVRSDSRWHGDTTMEVMDRVQSGVTSRQWVVEHVGAPDSSYTNARGNEVLRYVAKRETDADVKLFLLFSIDVSQAEIYTMHVEIEDDIVHGWWVE